MNDFTAKTNHLKHTEGQCSQLVIWVVAVLLVLISHRSNAQSITSYTFSSSVGTFTPLSGGTLNGGQGTVDDGAWNSNPIGFDFWYMGNRYTSISASTNGWLALGNSISSYGYVNSLSNASTANSTTLRPVLAPLWDDLSMRNVNDFSYQTSGTAGNRIFTAEYKNAEWQYAATTECISFQVKMYESTGKIEFIYRTEAGALSASPSASIGITGNVSGSYLSLNGTGSNPTASSTAETTSLNTRPATGQTYSFTPPVPANPSSLTFSGVTSSSITLGWTDNSSNETGFLIYRSNDNGATYEYISKVSSGVTSYTQSGLFSNTNYTFKVYAVSEGALSTGFATGSQSTLVCGNSVVNRTWVGAGNGGSGTVFNASSNWNPIGSPTCADSLYLPITSSTTITLGSSIEVGAINAMISGSGNVLTMNTNAFILQVNQTATYNITSGDGNTQLIVNADNGGSIVYTKDATFSASAGSLYPINGNGNSNGTVKFKGNVTFNGNCFSNTVNLPAKVVFDAATSQTVAFNNTGSLILLGSTSTDIGGQNNPYVTITGSGNNSIYGNLTVYGTSTLELTTSTLNRYSPGGSLNLSSGSTLKLGGNTGGQSGSNFPMNFSVIAFDQNSTVNYSGGNGINQTIYAVPSYGNLAFSNSSGTGVSTKTPIAGLTIRGSLSIDDSFSIFQGGNSLTHTVQGNWINNGLPNSGSFICGSGNTIMMNGTSSQIIMGSSATTFNNLTLNNGNILTLSPTSGITTTVSNLLTLTSGNVILGNFDLAIGSVGTSGNISGANATSFIVTNGTGTLNQFNIGSGKRTSVLFPVGINSTSYTPLQLDLAGTTATDNFKVAVRQGVKEQGSTGNELTANAVNRTWELSEGTSGGSSVVVTLNWSSSEELTGFDRAASSVSYTYNGTWWETDVTGSATAAAGMYSRTSGILTTVAPLRVANHGITLPVELVSFDGKCDEGMIKFEWTTASETNNDYFTIEQSVDGETFKPVGYISGAGNSNYSINYQYRHESDGAGLYRLKQTDFNGRSETFRIISVKSCASSDELKLFATYAGSDQVHVSIFSPADQKTILTIYENSGKQVFHSENELKAGANMIPVETDHLSPGIYFITVYNAQYASSIRFMYHR